MKLSNGEITTTLSGVITVYPNVTGISLDESDIVILKDVTNQLTATISPDNAWNKAVAWSSDDESVVEVDEAGLVTGQCNWSAGVRPHVLSGPVWQ